MQFITITGLLDRIVARIEGAWINGVIDADQRSRMIRGWTDDCRRYVTSMQELRTRTMQEALNAGKRQEARLIEQRVEKDAANDRIAKRQRTPPGRPNPTDSLAIAVRRHLPFPSRC